LRGIVLIADVGGQNRYDSEKGIVLLNGGWPGAGERGAEEGHPKVMHRESRNGPYEKGRQE